MEDRIKARIAELEQAERKTEMELIAIRTVLGELRKLLASESPEMSGDPLGEQSA